MAAAQSPTYPAYVHNSGMSHAPRTPSVGSFRPNRMIVQETSSSYTRLGQEGDRFDDDSRTITCEVVDDVTEEELQHAAAISRGMALESWAATTTTSTTSSSTSNTASRHSRGSSAYQTASFTESELEMALDVQEASKGGPRLMTSPSVEAALFARGAARRKEDYSSSAVDSVSAATAAAGRNYRNGTAASSADDFLQQLTELLKTGDDETVAHILSVVSHRKARGGTATVDAASGGSSSMSGGGKAAAPASGFSSMRSGHGNVTFSDDEIEGGEWDPDMDDEDSFDNDEEEEDVDFEPPAPTPLIGPDGRRLQRCVPVKQEGPPLPNKHLNGAAPPSPGAQFGMPGMQLLQQQQRQPQNGGGMSMGERSFGVSSRQENVRSVSHTRNGAIYGTSTMSGLVSAMSAAAACQPGNRGLRELRRAHSDHEALSGRRAAGSGGEMTLAAAAVGAPGLVPTGYATSSITPDGAAQLGSTFYQHLPPQPAATTSSSSISQQMLHGGRIPRHARNKTVTAPSHQYPAETAAQAFARNGGFMTVGPHRTDPESMSNAAVLPPLQPMPALLRRARTNPTERMHSSATTSAAPAPAPGGFSGGIPGGFPGGFSGQQQRNQQPMSPIYSPRSPSQHSVALNVQNQAQNAKSCLAPSAAPLRRARTNPTDRISAHPTIEGTGPPGSSAIASGATSIGNEGDFGRGNPSGTGRHVRRPAGSDFSSVEFSPRLPRAVPPLNRAQTNPSERQQMQLPLMTAMSLDSPSPRQLALSREQVTSAVPPAAPLARARTNPTERSSSLSSDSSGEKFAAASGEGSAEKQRDSQQRRSRSRSFTLKEQRTRSLPSDSEAAASLQTVKLQQPAGQNLGEVTNGKGRRERGSKGGSRSSFSVPAGQEKSQVGSGERTVEDVERRAADLSEAKSGLRALQRHLSAQGLDERSYLRKSKKAVPDVWGEGEHVKMKKSLTLGRRSEKSAAERRHVIPSSPRRRQEGKASAVGKSLSEGHMPLKGVGGRGVVERGGEQEREGRKLRHASLGFDVHNGDDNIDVPKLTSKSFDFGKATRFGEESSLKQAKGSQRGIVRHEHASKTSQEFIGCIKLGLKGKKGPSCI